MTQHHVVLGEARHLPQRLAELHLAFTDPLTRGQLLRRLREWLGFLPFEPSGMAVDEAVTAALPWIDQLLTARAPWAVVGAGVPARQPRRAPAPAPRAEAPEAPRRTWIGIELHDEQDRPCAGEAWRIRLADGSERTGWLDESGRAVVHGIEPGTCQVCFPALDRGEWRAA